ncbi:C5a anaphylatoxin chemotactic receptor 1-like [Pyxicephalus adspersus]|uniref:C5a anaphylatoxin chemotactic receptor 1-like n=1 Tax=Pyxicephalus adspersus TaxID=30357 RepID=UPI003B59B1F5
MPVLRTEQAILSEKLCYTFWDLKNRSSKTKFRYLSTEISYVGIALVAIACVIGVFTNGIVIYITGYKMKEQKSRMWFLNLAVADILFLLTTPMRGITLGKNWPLGSIVCKLSHFAFVCNIYSSSFLITALSIDRVLSVAKPVWHNQIFTQRCYLDNGFALWNTSLYKEGQHFSNIFYIPIIAIGYFIPLCVIIFTNLIIVLHVRKSKPLKTKKIYKFMAIFFGVFVINKTTFAVANIIYVEHVRKIDLSHML